MGYKIKYHDVFEQMLSGWLLALSQNINTMRSVESQVLEQVEQSSKLRKLHFLTVMQPLNPGRKQHLCCITI